MTALPKRAGFLLLLPVLSILLFAHGNALAAAPHISTSLPGIGSSFAVADFDGDHQPDFAKVEKSAADHDTSSYFVHFKLSAAGHEYVRLVVPASDVRVDASDINGDDAIDLVFWSIWESRPVAVLLNDGKGKFSQIQPASFADILEWPAGPSLLTATRFVPAIPLARVPSYFVLDATNVPEMREPTRASALVSFPPIANPLQKSLFGRAPPFSAPYLFD